MKPQYVVGMKRLLALSKTLRYEGYQHLSSVPIQGKGDHPQYRGRAQEGLEVNRCIHHIHLHCTPLGSR